MEGSGTAVTARAGLFRQGRARQLRRGLVWGGWLWLGGRGKAGHVWSRSAQEWQSRYGWARRGVVRCSSANRVECFPGTTEIGHTGHMEVRGEGPSQDAGRGSNRARGGGAAVHVGIRSARRPLSPGVVRPAVGVWGLDVGREGGKACRIPAPVTTSRMGRKCRV